MYELTVLGKFAAAHSLRNFKGKCEDLHGHNWKIEVVVTGTELDKADLLMDFGDLKALMNQALDRLDHKYLNELPPFDQLNPSSEQIAKHLFSTIAQGLPSQVTMKSVSAWESDNAKATYLGE
ncbi:6-carboxytetrahydropterin synthase QueD [Dethiosulfatarculus sandiegensis]|uniref:6-carboxy-5,6,7,8-tetrahydropterin synthase n=1 Tax=Dethiosulfatarculus sandiegensis TaxID=1429043 RepID=A0A0D2JUJ3_9BACT|nr:6-carboxytetrahydropterin synthase QueD [Dethiosulfatarculus sandiegensis]KIX13185.1 6-pyruvoyl tetrahydrobiopterin synthase [Dethiosulfatarculus sandiegensis]